MTYIDKALPFGLRSAPKIFTTVADALTWAILQSGVGIVLHYLDDFFFCSPPGLNDCDRVLGISIPLCQKLNLPVAPQKVVGPTTTLCFLDIEIDSVNQVLRMPQDKLGRLKKLLCKWSRKKAATKHELQCFLGHLGHAARVVRPGRTFLHELISTMSIPSHGYHKVRLNSHCRADITWWRLFCEKWNGISFFPINPASSIAVVSDASGSWGCGAFIKSSHHWFQLEWPSHWEGVAIMVKELIRVVVSPCNYMGSIMV